VFINGHLGDGYHIRHVITDEVCKYAEEYPAVDFNIKKIFDELGKIDWNSNLCSLKER